MGILESFFYHYDNHYITIVFLLISSPFFPRDCRGRRYVYQALGQRLKLESLRLRLSAAGVLGFVKALVVDAELKD